MGPRPLRSGFGTKGRGLPAPLSESIATYCSDTRTLEALPTSTEATFYPDIRTLLSAVLRHEQLPFDVRTGTSEKGAASHDMPDFVLGDGALFVGVYGEVKRAGTSLEDLAGSTEQKDQIGRYLAQTGVVLLCNVRGFGLLVCAPDYFRDGVTPVPPSHRVLEKTVDLWSAVSGGTKPKVDADAITGLVETITRAATDLARIASPADLAKILARQARDAKEALPEDLKPLKPLLDDYRQALGLAFDIDDEKGARSSSARRWSSRLSTRCLLPGSSGINRQKQTLSSISMTRTSSYPFPSWTPSFTTSATRRE